jgi:hypothetical protein
LARMREDYWEERRREGWNNERKGGGGKTWREDNKAYKQNPPGG